jgi:hypothetical protein
MGRSRGMPINREWTRLVGAVGLARGQGPQQRSKEPREFAALSTISRQTANLGRVEKVAGPSFLDGWDGRLYENLRNDFVGAVPRGILERGEDSGSTSSRPMLPARWSWCD